MPFRPHLVASLASACLLGFAILPAHALPRYEVFDLGALLGPGDSSGAQINEAGQVIGDWGAGRSFLYTPGAGITDVATLVGSAPGTPIEARGLNNLGQVVGRIGDGGFVWRPGSGAELLGPTFHGPVRINDAGQYIGSGYDTDHGFGYRYTPGTGAETLPLYELVHDLNAGGQVAGYVIDGDGTNQAARWDIGGTDLLGHIGGTYGVSNALNTAGDTVGFAGDAANRPHAFLYTDTGGMRDLDTLGFTGDGAGSFASAINDHGLVGGAYQASGLDPQRAFLWDDTSGMVDLNTLLEPSGVGWTILEVSDINNHGQIVGTGLFNGQTRAFILNAVAAPVPEPETWAMLLAALPLLRWARRRGERSAP